MLSWLDPKMPCGSWATGGAAWFWIWEFRDVSRKSLKFQSFHLECILCFGLLTNHPWDVAPRCSEVLSSVFTVKLFPGTPRPGVSWGSGDLGCVAGVEINTTGDACSCSYCSAWCSHSFEAQRDVCHSVLSHAFPISCLRSSPRPILLALCGLKSCENVSFWGIQRGWSDRLEANDYLLDLYIFQQSEPQMTCDIFSLESCFQFHPLNHLNLRILGSELLIFWGTISRRSLASRTKNPLSIKLCTKARSKEPAWSWMRRRIRGVWTDSYFGGVCRSDNYWLARKNGRALVALVIWE